MKYIHTLTRNKISRQIDLPSIIKICTLKYVMKFITKFMQAT